MYFHAGTAALFLLLLATSLTDSTVFVKNSNLKKAVSEYMKDPPKGQEKYGEINTWDVKAITSMKSLFKGIRSDVIVDLSQWNTARVKDMSYMFKDADLTVRGLDQVRVS